MDEDQDCRICGLERGICTHSMNQAQGCKQVLHLADQAFAQPVVISIHSASAGADHAFEEVAEVT